MLSHRSSYMKRNWLASSIEGCRWRGAARPYLLLIVIGLAVMTTASAVWGANVTPQQLKPPQKSAPSAAEISEARQRLAELGYWVKLEVARLDDSLRHALIAFQKIEGRPRTGQLTSAELQALRAARRPLPLEAGYPHIEVDLSRQVLFVVDVGGAGLRILPPSRRSVASRSTASSRVGAGVRSDYSFIRTTSSKGLRFTGTHRCRLTRRATAASASQCLPKKSSAR
jgi:hypothetical protein